MRPVNANAINEKIEEVINAFGGYIAVQSALRTALKIIKRTPTIEPPQGEWLFGNNYKNGRRNAVYEEWYSCTACNGEADKMYPFCPYCGAKMKGGEA